MGILDRLEQSFTQLEGTIFSLFRIQLQPVEISKRLERAMLADKRIGAGKTLVPNAYEVHLNPGDYKEFAGYKDSLCRDLAMALTEAARKHRVTPLTAIHIDLLQDKSVPARNPRVSAQMIDRPRQHTPVNEYSASAARGHTSVFIPAASAGGFRFVVENGAQAGQSFTIPDGTSTLGRSSDNTFVLDEPDVSRRHAKLERNGGNMQIQDLSSRNGTWINGESVHISDIQPGDSIRLGSQELRLEATANAGRSTWGRR